MRRHCDGLLGEVYLNFDHCGDGNDERVRQGRCPVVSYVLRGLTL